jgi:Flp pilus assembly protein TadD
MMRGAHMLIRLNIISLLLSAIAAANCANAQQVSGCGSLENSFGPFDYRDSEAKAQHLQVVEVNHFTPEVESLTRGLSDVHVIGDIDYTLRAFPNHHRALNAVAKYSLLGGQFSVGKIPSADCYFQRAIVFRPEDETVRMLYGNYLVKRGNVDDARRQYEEALRLAPDSVEVNYNAGLFFVEQGDIVRAEQMAKIAYDGGYPLPGLKKKIAAAESKRPR